MRIQAVFFDMGGTIDTYGFTPALRRSKTPGIQDLLLRGGIELDLDNEELFQVVSAGLKRYKTWSLDSEEELSPLVVWRDFILPDFEVEQAQLAHIAEDLMCYIETSYFDRKIRPEIPGILQAIQERGYKMGIISNVNSQGQVLMNLNEYGIIDYFDPIVLSSEYGRRKPDPAIFHHAATLAQVPTSRCLFVGDRISRDILGARRAGFGLAVHILHHDLPEKRYAEVIPDYTISVMTELLDILSTCDQDQVGRSHSEIENPIKAVFFDAGDILYHREQKGHYFHQFLRSLHLEPLPDLKQATHDIRQQAFRGEKTQREFHTALLNAYGILNEEEVNRGLAAIQRDENNVSFFPAVREVLQGLKDRGYLLGIITDTANPIHVKLSWFERGGFGHIWDGITSSADVGVRKPDPKVYQSAIQQFGILSSQALFVGHKASELDGAKEQGMITVAFNYDRNAQADYYISELRDLLELPLLLVMEDSSTGRVRDE